jgi:hypothetical protein
LFRRIELIYDAFFLGDDKELSLYNVLLVKLRPQRHGRDLAASRLGLGRYRKGFGRLLVLGGNLSS